MLEFRLLCIFKKLRANCIDISASWHCRSFPKHKILWFWGDGPYSQRIYIFSHLPSQNLCKCKCNKYFLSFDFSNKNLFFVVFRGLGGAKKYKYFSGVFVSLFALSGFLGIPGVSQKISCQKSTSF